ncbi:hypothetical protein EV193_113120 [Herbihabitans rhizosphaerae]|uniref:Uncharacterized protein n=1 Tax=Herbihabitans rhizosphaerae TaxID=1872711 RepID=A0A4Q7KFG9_9PSEU|nr:hypothetical protein EV193_113120 [Herbihabitans rhizosphaerae]
MLKHRNGVVLPWPENARTLSDWSSGSEPQA